MYQSFKQQKQIIINEIVEEESKNEEEMNTFNKHLQTGNFNPIGHSDATKAAYICLIFICCVRRIQTIHQQFPFSNKENTC